VNLSRESHTAIISDNASISPVCICNSETKKWRYKFSFGTQFCHDRHNH